MLKNRRTGLKDYDFQGLDTISMDHIGQVAWHLDDAIRWTSRWSMPIIPGSQTIYKLAPEINPSTTPNACRARCQPHIGRSRRHDAPVRLTGSWSPQARRDACLRVTPRAERSPGWKTAGLRQGSRVFHRAIQVSKSVGRWIQFWIQPPSAWPHGGHHIGCRHAEVLDLLRRQQAVEKEQEEQSLCASVAWFHCVCVSFNLIMFGEACGLENGFPNQKTTHSTEIEDGSGVAPKIGSGFGRQTQTRPRRDCQSGLPRNGQGWCRGGQLIGIYGSPMECLGML